MSVQVTPAWRASRRDGITPVRDGWQVIADGEWVQTFPTKRAATKLADALPDPPRPADPEEDPVTAPAPADPDRVTLTRADLLDLLTTACQIGRNDDTVGRAHTRGDITEVIERRLRDQLAALDRP